MRQFTLPDLGEGLEEAEIVAWFVNEGDHVVADQPLVSVETDKAVVEVPSPWSGTHRATCSATRATSSRSARRWSSLPRATEAGHRHRCRRGRTRAKPSRARGRGSGLPREPRGSSGAAGDSGAGAQARRRSQHRAGTAPAATITRADVERAARSMVEAGPAEPLRGMRRAMAQRMAVANAEVVPHHGDGGGRHRRLAQGRGHHDPAGAGDRCRMQSRAFPQCLVQRGSRRTAAASNRVDLGIAVDTEGGLIVPVLRNVGERDAKDLRAGLDRLRADAAARSIPPEELRGATITLSNFGMIGGRFANLVVVPPQVAIVGAGRAQRVWSRRDQQSSPQLPLSLTFDHRAVTGGEAARFLVRSSRTWKGLMPLFASQQI